ncbi:MAG: tRNA dihydrouridine synthase DusB [Niabella sp.]|nr:MAG: tRNA dihydrouridine synthase DusB [Niabella sp.]
MILEWNKINKPIIALSPMADMTDSPFCQIVKEVTGESDYPVMFREMVSSEAVVRGNEKTLDMTEIDPSERPLVQQIFGSDPEIMAQSAAIIAHDHKPEGFDINMGCPVYKITHNFNGCALMNDPDRACDIVKAMKALINVPLSVKIRLGWSDKNTCLTFAPKLEQAGANLITVHGRTKAQGYSGVSDWAQIAEVKKVVSVPLLANGDIHTPESVIKALEITKADGVLIARGALGNPWFFKQAKDLIETGKYEVPSFEERINVVKRHFDLHVQKYGDHGVYTFRKHLQWYFKGMENAKHIKEKFNNAKIVSEMHDAFHALSNNF